MRGQKRLAGALAAVAAAMAISACGSSSDNSTIPPENANQLLSALNGVQSALDSQDCKLAQERANAFVNTVNELPDTVSTDDKEMLRSAGENLDKLAQDPAQCKPPPDTGASGEAGTEPTSTTETSTSLPTTTTETTTTSTSTAQPEPPSNQGNGGGEPSGGGDTGGGGGVGGGSGGTGGTGTGGTGGTG
jgi:hypothetical protein